MSEGLIKLAKVLHELTWREMAAFSEAIFDEIPELRKADKLEPHGLAHFLINLADDIEKEAAARKEQPHG